MLVVRCPDLTVALDEGDIMDSCHIGLEDMMDEDLPASGAVTSGVMVDSFDSFNGPASECP